MVICGKIFAIARLHTYMPIDTAIDLQEIIQSKVNNHKIHKYSPQKFFLIW